MWVYTLLPKILNMSLTAGIVIVLVLLARIPLKKAPKIFSYALWAVVLFRLVCPVSFSSEFSLLGVFHAPGVINGSISYIPADIVPMEYPQAELPLPIISEVINDNLPQGEEQAAADPLEWQMAAAAALWLAGVAAMLIYSAVTLALLRRKLIGSVRLRENIYLADHIATPFVIGVIRPKIYLPSYLAEQEQSYIILHEQTHIRRFDHIFKMIAFLVLAVHWFNPLVWVAFAYCVKDMEMSCDERVLKEMGGEIKQAYSRSLLSLAAGRRLINGSPLAFGEGNIKDRIKNVMNFKKPGARVMVVSVLLVASLTVGFAANRATPDNPPDWDTTGLEPASPKFSSEGWERISREDVNWDRRDEDIYLDKSQIEEGLVTLRIIDELGVELWSEQLSTSHAGWDSLFLYKSDGKQYFLRYNPGMWQGYCTYTYTLFTLEGGKEKVFKSNTLEFDINGTKELDALKMVAFADEVNTLLGKSILLISSEGGNFYFGLSSAEPFFELYSWLDDMSELYRNGDSLESRLKKYSEYAIFNFSDEGQAFQITAYEFAKAFFEKNTEVMKRYLLNPDEDFYEYDLDYGLDDIEYMRLKFNPKDAEKGSVSAQYEFNLDGEDSYTYLQLSIKKVNDEWKVEFYGLEK